MAIGFKTGGRKPGGTNSQREVQKKMQDMFGRLIPKAEVWIKRTAKKHPGKAAALVLQLGEHFVPKMGRLEPEPTERKQVYLTIIRKDGAQVGNVPPPPELPPKRDDPNVVDAELVDLPPPPNVVPKPKDPATGEHINKLREWARTAPRDKNGRIQKRKKPPTEH